MMFGAPVVRLVTMGGIVLTGLIVAGPVVAAPVEDRADDGAIPSLDVQVFRPAIDSHDFVWVNDAALPARGGSFRAVFSWASAPLRYTAWDQQSRSIIGNVSGFHLAGSLRAGRSRLGFDLPVLGASGGGTGVGDLAVDVKSRLSGSASRVAIASVVRVTLPTGEVQGLSSRQPTGSVEAIVEGRASRLALAANLGVMAVPTVDLEGTPWGSRGFARLGLTAPLGVSWSLAAEAYAARGVVVESRGLAEAGFSVGWRPASEDASSWAFRAATFRGLTDGPGSPGWRGVLSLAYDPLRSKALPDRDIDGVVDTADDCPIQPEDRDGWQDSDGCAEQTLVAVIVRDTEGDSVPGAKWTTASGKYGVSGEFARLPSGRETFRSAGPPVDFDVPVGPPVDVTLRVPAARAPFRVTVVDASGKPVPDAKWTSVKNTSLTSAADLEVLVRPGHYEISVSAPDFGGTVLRIDIPEGGASPTVVLSPSRARWVGGRIALSEPLRFEGRARLTRESEKILDDIAALLKRYPEIRRVRIDSHTGVAGEVWSNQTISDARADAVRNALVRRGIASSRLQPLGYGGSRPLAEGTSAVAEARNRRIELLIVSSASRRKR